MTGVPRQLSFGFAAIDRRHEQANRLRALAEAGLDYRGISESLNLSERYVRCLVRRYGISMQQLPADPYMDVETKMLYFAWVRMTRDQIACALGRSYDFVCKFARERGIRIVRKRHERLGVRRPEIDRLAAAGQYSMEEIGRRVRSMRTGERGISKQRVHEYLKATGQLEEFRRRRSGWRSRRAAN